jgi:hypothetical protein
VTPSLSDLAQSFLNAREAWDKAAFMPSGLPRNDDLFAKADDELWTARKSFEGALFAQTGISREMFERLGVVL